MTVLVGGGDPQEMSAVRHGADTARSRASQRGPCAAAHRTLPHIGDGAGDAVGISQRRRERPTDLRPRRRQHQRARLGFVSDGDLHIEGLLIAADFGIHRDLIDAVAVIVERVVEVRQLQEQIAAGGLNAETQRPAGIVDAEPGSIDTRQAPHQPGGVSSRRRRVGRDTARPVLGVLNVRGPRQRRQLDHVGHRDRHRRGVGVRSVAHAHRHLIDPIRIRVPRVLEILRYRERQLTGVCQREMALIGADGDRPLQILCGCVCVGGNQRRHHRRALLN